MWEGPRNHVVDGVKIPHREGVILGLSVEKIWESPLQCTQQKGLFQHQ